MPNDLQERLTKAREQLRKKQKLAAMLQEAQTILSQEQQKCRQCEQILAKEQADVEKLEGFSLTGLFYSILGTKDERLETEKQEFLAAKLKHEECSQAVEETQREVNRLQSQLAEVSGAEAEYDRVMKEKEQFLAQAGDHRATKLMTFTERVADLEADRKELQEAISAGTTAKNSLEDVCSELRSAENWGTWDMLGGGTISTWAKHSKIDSAKEQAQVAQRELRKFREELADADHRLHVSLGDIGGFSTFADYFFDGLIFDWVMQSKIQKASEACHSAIRQVAFALGECRRTLAETEETIQHVENERQTFIEQA